MTTELAVSLWRGAQDGRYETYWVPQRDSQTVLDVVTFVQRHIGRKVLDHRQILKRTDFKCAAVGALGDDLGDMGAAGPARFAVDRHCA